MGALEEAKIDLEQLLHFGHDSFVHDEDDDVNKRIVPKVEKLFQVELGFF